jgi:hypothetical protein
MALDYATRVRDGQRAACRYVRIACETFLQDYSRALEGKGPWAFDATLAHDAMAFAYVHGDFPRVCVRFESFVTVPP